MGENWPPVTHASGRGAEEGCRGAGLLAGLGRGCQGLRVARREGQVGFVGVGSIAYELRDLDQFLPKPQTLM